MQRRSRFQITKLTSLLVTFALSAGTVVGFSQQVHAAPLISKMTGFNGRVWTITEPDSNGIRYLGGDFSSYNAWQTGNGAWVNKTTGDVETNFGSVSGEVFASVSDGAGGAYLAGSVGSYNGTGRNKIVHVLADGSIDAVFQPGTVNDQIWGIDVDANAVYIGGKFTAVDGAARNRAAALDRTTGALLSWNPNAGSWVHTVHVAGSNVYLGGRFTTMGGVARMEVAKLRSDARSNSTGTCLDNFDSTDCLSAFAPPITGGYGVYDVYKTGTHVYVGGSFTASQSSVSVATLARFDETTGSLDTTWNPNISGNTTTGINTASNPGGPMVYTMDLSGTTMYIGGKFTSVGGQTRSRLAAVDISNAAVTSWAPTTNSGGVYNSNNNVELQDGVSSIDVDGSTVYVAGGFFFINGVARNRAGAVDASTGALTSWDPHTCDASNGAANHVRTVASLGSNVFLGGNFSCMGGLKRYHAAAVGPDGILTDWTPQVNAPVQEMSSDGTTIYMVGRFTNVNDNVRQYAAAVRTDETVTAWSPQLSVGLCGGGEKQSVLQTSTFVYVGGCFSSVSGVARVGLAATDRTTGAVETGFNANVGQADVRSLAVDDYRLYVGGAFTTVGGQARTWIAGVDKTTGALDTGWDPGTLVAAYDGAVRKAVHSIKIKDSQVYIGGWFGTIGGVTQRYLAALSQSNGALDTNWRPTIGTATAGGIFSLSINGDKIYFAGAGTTPVAGTAIGYASRTDGTVSTWMNNGGMTEVRGIAGTDAAVFIGGEFGSVAGSTRSRSAAISLDGTVMDPWPLVATENKSLAVSITTAGVSPGIVTSNPVGINCGGSCKYGFANSTTVTLTAIPQSGTEFGGWSGACSSLSTTCTVSLSAAKTTVASFVAIGAAPTASPTPSASATPSPSSSSSNSSSTQSEVTPTPTPTVSNSESNTDGSNVSTKSKSSGGWLVGESQDVNTAPTPQPSKSAAVNAGGKEETTAQDTFDNFINRLALMMAIGLSLIAFLIMLLKRRRNEG